jgi:hypothetical protein
MHRDENHCMSTSSSIKSHGSNTRVEQVVHPTLPLSLVLLNMSVNGTAALPNQFTPLAFLPPSLANQYEASRYLYVATLGVSGSINCGPRRQLS